MCLPFDCGGDPQDHDRDHPSTQPGGNQHHRHPPPPPPTLSPPPPQRYVLPSYDQEDAHHTQGMAAGGKAKPKHRNGGTDAAPWHVAGVNENNGGRMTPAFHYSDADVPAAASAGVGRGRKSAAEKNMVPTLAAQAPHHQHNFVSASPPHGSVAASQPKEASSAGGKMRAPPVVQMPRRGGEDGYPAAATATPVPAANNLYGDRDYDDDDDRAYGNRGNRKPQGNSWW